MFLKYYYEFVSSSISCLKEFEEQMKKLLSNAVKMLQIALIYHQSYT
jgi:hypothetical protein